MNDFNNDYNPNNGYNGYTPYPNPNEFPVKKPEAKVWSIFALIGFIGGIVTFVAALLSTVFPAVFVYMASLSEFFIVFSALGIKSSKRRAMAIIGLVLAVIALFTSIIVTTLYMQELYDYLYNFFYSLLEDAYSAGRYY